jgi:hypothetical protein
VICRFTNGRFYGTPSGSLIGAIVGANCATSRETYTADGRAGYSINCSGSALNWGMCFEKAGDLCGERGYTVLEKSSDQGSVVSGTQYGLYGGSVMNRSMIVQCKQ